MKRLRLRVGSGQARRRRARGRPAQHFGKYGVEVAQMRLRRSWLGFLRLRRRAHMVNAVRQRSLLDKYQQRGKGNEERTVHRSQFMAFRFGRLLYASPRDARLGAHGRESYRPGRIESRFPARPQAGTINAP